MNKNETQLEITSRSNAYQISFIKSAGGLRFSSCGGFSRDQYGTAYDNNMVNLNYRWFGKMVDPKKITIKMEDFDEEQVGEYDLSINFGYKNHAENPGVTMTFNITILSEDWVEPEETEEEEAEGSEGEGDAEGSSSDSDAELTSEEIALQEEATAEVVE